MGVLSRALRGAELRLSRSPELFTALFNALPIAAFALDAEGRAIAWNAAAERAFGWPATEVLGKDAPFGSQAARAVLAAAAAAAHVGDLRSFDLPFIARDGSPRRARIRGAALGLGDTSTGIVFIDVGGVDRADLERADPYESSLLQTIVDAIPTPIWFKTTDGIYRGCNLAFEQALGKTRDQLVGRTVDAAAPGDIAAVYREADRALFESGGTQFYEGELRNAEGVRRKVMFHKAAFRDHSGAVAGLAGALVDVTELRRTEADLRHALEILKGSESRFFQLVESAPDLVLMHRDGRILYANPAMAALVGRPVAELAETPVLDWIHSDDRPLLAERLRATGRLPPAEWRILASDGRHVPVEFIAIGLDMQDGPVRVSIGRDLTERKNTEERLQRSDRLASLGTLAAGVAHELNNPLSFVLSNAEWAIEQLTRDGGPTACQVQEVVQGLRDVVQGAHRMRVIVSDLRTVAREETVSDTLAPVDLRRVVDFAVQLTAGELRRRARLDFQAEPVPPVLGSETRLGQVIVNLLVNAAQAMPDADPARNVIGVALKRGPDRCVEVSITDNGCGISPEAQPHLFEPFFTTKPVGEGTGLGLWVCHNIIEAHGGAIRVESAPGHGTTFRVLLPAAEETRAETPGAPPAQKSQRRSCSLPP